MNALDKLLSCAGTWRGVNRLWVSPDEPPDESASTITLTALLGKRFVRIDQTWSREGRPQEGSLLVGCDGEAPVATACWIDTFHMGRKMMICTGVVGEDGTVDVRGSYAAPPGPDWGWRITVGAAEPGRLQIVMYNVEPGGKEAVAVRGVHTRA